MGSFYLYAYAIIKKHMNLWARNLKQNGFTIVELLVVIVVISILASVTVVAFSGIQERAIEAMARSDLKANHTKILQYQILNNSYPSGTSRGDRQQFAATGCTPGTVDGAGKYCPIVSHDKMYVNYTAISDSPGGFTLLMGVGTTGYAIDADGSIKTMNCPVSGSAPPSPGFTTVYDCPMSSVSSYRNFYSQ